MKPMNEAPDKDKAKNNLCSAASSKKKGVKCISLFLSSLVHRLVPSTEESHRKFGVANYYFSKEGKPFSNERNVVSSPHLAQCATAIIFLKVERSNRK